MKWVLSRNKKAESCNDNFLDIDVRHISVATEPTGKPS